MTDPEHAAAMWRLALEGPRVPEAARPKLLIEAPGTRPLEVYEEVAGL